MARKVGINQNVQQRFISGCRVPFDPRTTAEVCDTISVRNGKADEKHMRKMAWESRRRHEHSDAA